MNKTSHFKKNRENHKNVFIVGIFYLLFLFFIFVVYNIDSINSFHSFYSSSSNKLICHDFLPKIIWIFWDDDIPENLRFLLHNLKEKLISYKIVYICNSTIYNYINMKDIPSGLNILPKPNQVDFYKFYLIYHYGGVWLDSSTYICNETFISQFSERVEENKAMLGAFNYEFHPNYHIEAGFLIAPIQSPFLYGVLKEIDICVKMGRIEYINKRVDEGIIVKSKQIIKYNETERIIEPYFYVYVCILTVLQRDFNNNANLELLKAEDYMYKLHTFCKWRGKCMNREWMNETSIINYPIIKFNGVNRKRISFPKVDII